MRAGWSRAPKAAADGGEHAVAAGDALGLGGEGRVDGEGVEAEAVAHDAPLGVGDDADEDLAAIGAVEDVVDGPGGAADAHGGRGLAGDGGLGHVLGDEDGVGLEQADLDVAAGAGAVAFLDGGEDAECGEGAAQDVVDAGAGAHGFAGETGHVGEAAHHLHDLVEGDAVFVGAGEEALAAAVDEAWVGGFQGAVGQAELVEGAGAEVLDEDVGGFQEFQDGAAAGRGFQVQHDAAFVAVHDGEEAGAGGLEPAGIVAGGFAVLGGGFDLDDVGAEVGEHEAAGGAHDHVGEFDDAESGEGAQAAAL